MNAELIALWVAAAKDTHGVSLMSKSVSPSRCCLDLYLLCSTVADEEIDFQVLIV